MFEKENDPNKIESLIGEQCIITGDLKGSGLVKIDGHINGDLEWEDDIILGKPAYFKGNISCKNAVVNGRIEGNIVCDNTLYIESGGSIRGDLTIKKLIVQEGGSFNGRCCMLITKSAEDVIE